VQVRVCPIQLSFTNCYLIHSEGILLVDTRVLRDLASFNETLRSQCQLDIKEIQRVVITHAHFDHYWAAARLQSSVGAQVVVHKEDRAWLETGFVRAPPGVSPWGHMIRQQLSQVQGQAPFSA
jgi:glyoxylase-like metal-dependent hydrolase (beta-lactamase superfamily II)